MKPETLARARQTAQIVIPPLVSTSLMIACVFLFLLFYALFLPDWLVKPVIGTSGFIGAALGLIGLRWHRERSLTEVLSGRATILTALALLTAFGGLFLAGCLNPIVVHALPGSEIHVDGKYYRKVLPPEDGRPGGLQRERLLLKWEAHTIEIRNHPLAPSSVEVFHERFPWGWMHPGDSGSEHDAHCRSRLHVTPPVWQFESASGRPDIRIELLNRELRDDAHERAAGIFGDHIRRLPWDSRERREAEQSPECLTIRWNISEAGWNSGVPENGSAERRRITLLHRESRLAAFDAPPGTPGEIPDASTLHALWASSRGPAIHLLRQRIHDEELLRAVAHAFLDTPPDFEGWLRDHSGLESRAAALQLEISGLVKPAEEPAAPPDAAEPPRSDSPSQGAQNTGATRRPQPTGITPPAVRPLRKEVRDLQTLAVETARAASTQGERTRESMVNAIMESLSWASERIDDPELQGELAEAGRSLAGSLSRTGLVIDILTSRDDQRPAADSAGRVLTNSGQPPPGGIPGNLPQAIGPVAAVRIDPASDRHYLPPVTEVCYFTPDAAETAGILLQTLQDAGILSAGTTRYLLPGWQQRRRGTGLSSQIQITFGRSEPAIESSGSR